MSILTYGLNGTGSDLLLGNQGQGLGADNITLSTSSMTVTTNPVSIVSETPTETIELVHPPAPNDFRVQHLSVVAPGSGSTFDYTLPIAVVPENTFVYIATIPFIASSGTVNDDDRKSITLELVSSTLLRLHSQSRYSGATYDITVVEFVGSSASPNRFKVHQIVETDSWATYGTAYQTDYLLPSTVDINRVVPICGGVTPIWNPGAVHALPVLFATVDGSSNKVIRRKLPTGAYHDKLSIQAIEFTGENWEVDKAIDISFTYSTTALPKVDILTLKEETNSVSAPSRPSANSFILWTCTGNNSNFAPNHRNIQISLDDTNKVTISRGEGGTRANAMSAAFYRVYNPEFVTSDASVIDYDKSTQPVVTVTGNPSNVFAFPTLVASDSEVTTNYLRPIVDGYKYGAHDEGADTFPLTFYSLDGLNATGSSGVTTMRQVPGVGPLVSISTNPIVVSETESIAISITSLAVSTAPIGVSEIPTIPLSTVSVALAASDIAVSELITLTTPALTVTTNDVVVTSVIPPTQEVKLQQVRQWRDDRIVYSRNLSAMDESAAGFPEYFDVDGLGLNGTFPRITLNNYITRTNGATDPFKLYATKSSYPGDVATVHFSTNGVPHSLNTTYPEFHFTPQTIPLPDFTAVYGPNNPLGYPKKTFPSYTFDPTLLLGITVIAPGYADWDSTGGVVNFYDDVSTMRVDANDVTVTAADIPTLTVVPLVVTTNDVTVSEIHAIELTPIALTVDTKPVMAISQVSVALTSIPLVLTTNDVTATQIHEAELTPIALTVDTKPVMAITRGLVTLTTASMTTATYPITVGDAANILLSNIDITINMNDVSAVPIVYEGIDLTALAMSIDPNELSLAEALTLSSESLNISTNDLSVYSGVSLTPVAMGINTNELTLIELLTLSSENLTISMNDVAALHLINMYRNNWTEVQPWTLKRNATDKQWVYKVR